MVETLGHAAIGALTEAGQAFGPLVVVLTVVFVVFFRDVPRSSLLPMVYGVVLAGIGLVLFLFGVRAGFVPYAEAMGRTLAADGSVAMLIVASLALGLAVTVAEPAVRVLASEVDRVTTGSIRQKVVLYTIAVGVAVSVAINAVRIHYGIPLTYFIGPGYALALLMMAFSHPTFVGLAFDSGGVATGSMSVSFILSFAIGAATGTEGRDPVTEGLGVLALIAMIPILTVLLLGLVYMPRRKDDTNRKERGEAT